MDVTELIKIITKIMKDSSTQQTSVHLNESTKTSELKFDSLQVVELNMEVEETLGRELEAELFFADITIGELSSKF